MSVALNAECAGPEAVLAGHPGFALAAVKAGFVRECMQGITRDPLCLKSPPMPWFSG